MIAKYYESSTTTKKTWNKINMINIKLQETFESFKLFTLSHLAERFDDCEMDVLYQKESKMYIFYLIDYTNNNIIEYAFLSEITIKMSNDYVLNITNMFIFRTECIAHIIEAKRYSKIILDDFLNLFREKNTKNRLQLALLTEHDSFLFKILKIANLELPVEFNSYIHYKNGQFRYTYSMIIDHLFPDHACPDLFLNSYLKLQTNDTGFDIFCDKEDKYQYTSESSDLFDFQTMMDKVFYELFHRKIYTEYLTEICDLDTFLQDKRSYIDLINMQYI